MSATQLSFCSISALDRPLAAVAALAAAQGLDGIEATARPPHVDPGAGIGAARAAGRSIRAAGVEVVAYGSYLGRDGQLGDERARQEAALAVALGAPLLRVWAEPISGAPEDGFGDVVAMLRAASDAAAGDGVTVVVERHLGSFADTPERVERLLAAVDRANFALNYQVLDALPQRLAGAQPNDARRLVPHARYFHLKNYRPAEDGTGPMPPGASLRDGVLDYRAILAGAFDAGYTGPLTIEFLSFAPKPIEEKLADDLAFLRGVLRELGRA